jgi:hypothetical protein
MPLSELIDAVFDDKYAGRFGIFPDGRVKKLPQVDDFCIAEVLSLLE